MFFLGFVLGVLVTKYFIILEVFYSIFFFYKELIKVIEGVNNYVNFLSYLKLILSIFYYIYVKKI